jgi:hypothetical protein
MYTWRNPPQAFIGAEADRQIPFMVALVDLLPHLTIYQLEATKIQDSTYRICLVVENRGFMPTYTSQQGKKRKAVRPIRVELELPQSAKLVAGKQKLEMDHLEGRSNKLEVTSHFASSFTDNREVIEWSVQAPSESELTVRVASQRAGSITQSFTLP